MSKIKQKYMEIERIKNYSIKHLRTLESIANLLQFYLLKGTFVGIEYCLMKIIAYKIYKIIYH